MAYNATIPKATDKIKNSQADLLGNFAALIPFSENFADFPRLAVTPVITGTDVGIYNELYGATSQSELFINRLSGTAVPFTARGTGTRGGWCYLPSGILLKWGVYTFTAGNVLQTVPVNTISGGPNFGSTFTILVSSFWTGDPSSSTPSVVTLGSDGAPTTGNFTASTTNWVAITSKLSYLVIGV